MRDLQTKPGRSLDQLVVQNEFLDQKELENLGSTRTTWSADQADRTSMKIVSFGRQNFEFPSNFLQTLSELLYTVSFRLVFLSR